MVKIHNFTTTSVVQYVDCECARSPDSAMFLVVKHQRWGTLQRPYQLSSLSSAGQSYLHPLHLALLELLPHPKLHIHFLLRYSTLSSAGVKNTQCRAAVFYMSRVYQEDEDVYVFISTTLRKAYCNYSLHGFIQLIRNCC